MGEPGSEGDRTPLLVQIFDPRSPRELLLVAAGLVVSICALVATTVSIRQNLHHNKLSVVPKLDFAYELRRDRSAVGLVLHSNGIGPARVTAFEVQVEGRGRRTMAQAALYAAIDGVLTDPDAVVWTTFTRGDYVRAGTSHELFVLPPAGLRDTEAFRKFLKCDLVVEIDYCSLYDSDCRAIASNADCGTPP